MIVVRLPTSTKAVRDSNSGEIEEEEMSVGGRGESQPRRIGDRGAIAGPEFLAVHEQFPGDDLGPARA